MAEFMRNGGAPMWLILFATIVALVLAGMRRKGDGTWYALGGSLFVLIHGVLGYASGMVNVTAYAAKMDEAQKAEILVVGTREALNNLLFGSSMAFLLGAVAAGLGFMNRSKK